MIAHNTLLLYCLFSQEKRRHAIRGRAIAVTRLHSQKSDVPDWHKKWKRMRLGDTLDQKRQAVALMEEALDVCSLYPYAVSHIAHARDIA